MYIFADPGVGVGGMGGGRAGQLCFRGYIKISEGCGTSVSAARPMMMLVDLNKDWLPHMSRARGNDMLGVSMKF